MYFSASPTRPVPSMKGRAYPSRQPVKHDGLAILRDLEIPVATVIDVGAQFVTEELIEAYPDRPHLLIEPVAEYHAALKTRYTREGIDHVIAPVAVAERDGESDLVVQSVGGGGTVTHSRLVDERVPGADQRTRRVPMRRLDTLVAELGLAPPFLVKIDVDGGELRVLRGAPETLKRTNVVVIEAQIRNVVERSTPLVEAGFELFDIVDLCYHDHRLSQMDLVFVKKSLLEAEGKTIFANGFNPKAWFKLKSRS